MSGVYVFEPDIPEFLTYVFVSLSIHLFMGFPCVTSIQFLTYASISDLHICLLTINILTGLTEAGTLMNFAEGSAETNVPIILVLIAILLKVGPALLHFWKANVYQVSVNIYVRQCLLPVAH